MKINPTFTPEAFRDLLFERLDDDSRRWIQRRYDARHSEEYQQFQSHLAVLDKGELFAEAKQVAKEHQVRGCTWQSTKSAMILFICRMYVNSVVGHDLAEMLEKEARNEL